MQRIRNEDRSFNEKGESVVGKRENWVVLSHFLQCRFISGMIRMERSIEKHILKSILESGLTVTGFEITDNGGISFGRSDATLNPGGVEIGTAEIYRIVEEMDEIHDSLQLGKNGTEMKK